MKKQNVSKERKKKKKKKKKKMIFFFSRTRATANDLLGANQHLNENSTMSTIIERNSDAAFTIFWPQSNSLATTDAKRPYKWPRQSTTTGFYKKTQYERIKKKERKKIN
jgi:hypothetical protein